MMHSSTGWLVSHLPKQIKQKGKEIINMAKGTLKNMFSDEYGKRMNKRSKKMHEEYEEYRRRNP